MRRLSLYLAAAGVGTIGLADFDVVDLSNLQRQIIHFTGDVGRPKIVSAEEKLKAINPEVTIVRHEQTVDSSNALALFADYDVIVDGTDNFPTRYLVNDACVLLGKPNVYGSIFRFDGQATVFFPPEGPCYRCLYPEPPPPGLVPNCAEGGVLGILPGLIGVVQATETVKLILGTGKPLVGRLLLYDALEMTFREMKVRKNPRCPICGPNPTIRELIDYQEFCGIRRRRAAGRWRRRLWRRSRRPSSRRCSIKGSIHSFLMCAIPRRSPFAGSPAPRSSRCPSSPIVWANWTRPPRWWFTARAGSAAPRRSLCSRPPASPG